MGRLNFKAFSRFFVWSFMALSLYYPNIYPQTQNVSPGKLQRGVERWVFWSLSGYFLWKSLSRIKKNYFKTFQWLFKVFRLTFVFVHLTAKFFKRPLGVGQTIHTKYPLFKCPLPLKRKWNPMNVQSTHSCYMGIVDMHTSHILWLIKVMIGAIAAGVGTDSTIVFTEELISASFLLIVPV